MKIFAIGCTHGQHHKINVPEDIDIIIHTGDESNYRSPFLNQPELMDFIDWYSNLSIPHKLFVPGNHSSAVFHKLVTKKQFETYGITLLECESITIKDLIIYGNPWTPEFGNWHYNKDRAKMYKIWDTVPKNVDILISHGPPKGILDLSTDHTGKLKYTGCQNLMTQINKNNFKPELFVCSHIHDSNSANNYGIRKYNDITFANVSMVTDGKIGELTHQGIIFTFENKKIINIEIR